MGERKHMNELDTLVLLVGLLSGLGLATGLAQWLTGPRPQVNRIKWLAFNMSRFTPGAYMKGAK